MTNDKGAGDGPYRDASNGWMEDEFGAIEGPGFDRLPQKVMRPLDLLQLLNLAYAEGRKAERERCLAIIERWRPMTKQTWVTVSDDIGGQDGN